MDPNLVILAGGISSRMKANLAHHPSLDSELRRDASDKPKSMIRVGEGGRPLLDYLLLNAQSAGYREVIIVLNEQDRSIRAEYGEDGRNHPFAALKISYAVQTIPAGKTKPLGTADALLQALRARRDWQGCKFTVCNSDNLYSVEAFLRLRESHHPGALIDYDRSALKYEQSRIEQFSVIHRDAGGYLTAIVEKPTPDEYSLARDAMGRIGVSMNIFRFSYDRIAPILLRVPLHPVRQEQELPEAVMMLVREHPRSMMTIPLAEYVPDLTFPDDIARVREYLHMTYGGKSP